MNKPYPITSLFLLTILAGGCASANHAESAAPETTAKSAQTSKSASAPAPASARASGSTTPVPAAPKYTAIIDGKEVPCPDIPMGDDATIQRILDEGKTRCQVMDHLNDLTTQIGPRLTGSSNAYRANQWCMTQYEKWGLTNAHLEQWGTVGAGFDRGPS